MTAADFDSAVEGLKAAVAEASVILPFTGAGISTECGIPDFPGRDLDEEPADSVRRVSGEPGGTERILAAAFRNAR